MKIAITAKGPTLTDEVDPHFGRAKMFLIIDTETNEFEVVDNKQNLDAMQGAGIQAARLVAERNVAGVITGHCGPKAFRTLTAAEIKIYSDASGKIADTLAQFKNNELDALKEADVESHWV